VPDSSITTVHRSPARTHSPPYLTLPPLLGVHSSAHTTVNLLCPPPLAVDSSAHAKPSRCLVNLIQIAHCFFTTCINPFTTPGCPQQRMRDAQPLLRAAREALSADAQVQRQARDVFALLRWGEPAGAGIGPSLAVGGGLL
jgi:hypothetical protein